MTYERDGDEVIYLEGSDRSADVHARQPHPGPEVRAVRRAAAPERLIQYVMFAYRTAIRGGAW